MGAGKSVLARAIIGEAQRLAGEIVEDVPSPSFTLVQTYAAGGHEIWHCDLYRLGDPDDLTELGLDEALIGAILLIEWPELILGDLGGRYLDIRIEADGEGDDIRRLHVTPRGPGWDHLATILVGKAAR